MICKIGSVLFLIGEQFQICPGMIFAYKIRKTRQIRKSPLPTERSSHQNHRWKIFDIRFLSW